MQRRILGFGIVACVLLGAAAFAQGGPQRDLGLGPFLRPRVMARLNLTPDQLKHIQEIAKAHRAAVQAGQRPAAQANMAQERQALLKTIFSDKPDQGEIQKHLDALAQQQAAVEQRRQQQMSNYVDTLMEINKVLTPAQRSEFQKMLDENVRAKQIMRGRVMQRRRMLNSPAQQPPDQPKEN